MSVGGTLSSSALIKQLCSTASSSSSNAGSNSRCHHQDDSTALAPTILQLLPMDSANMVSLVGATVARQHPCLASLVQLPAAAELPVDSITAAPRMILRSTAPMDDYRAPHETIPEAKAAEEAVAALCRCPAEQQLIGAQLAEVMQVQLRKQALLQCASFGRLPSLRKLPAASQLDGELVGGLLTAASDLSKPNGTPWHSSLARSQACRVASLGSCAAAGHEAGSVILQSGQGGEVSHGKGA